MYRTLLILIAVSLLGCSPRFEPREAMKTTLNDVSAEIPDNKTDAPSESPQTDTSQAENPATGTPVQTAAAGESLTAAAEPQLATLGAGCFWCVEAVLEQLDGVLDVDSGYMGGTVESPTYKAVCTGTTGHAEVVQVRFDPAKISYGALLDYFWKLHDPTTLNQQGGDIGTQYRSAIFYHSEEQRALAEKSKAAAEGSFANPIVTEIRPASTYYTAEGYHQDYYRLNKSQRYCRFVIAPKLDKLGLQQ